MNFIKVTFASQILNETSFQRNVGRIYNLTETEQNQIYQTFYWLNAGKLKSDFFLFLKFYMNLI